MKSLEKIKQIEEKILSLIKEKKYEEIEYLFSLINETDSFKPEMFATH
jgi:hypothetical protein